MMFIDQVQPAGQVYLQPGERVVAAVTVRGELVLVTDTGRVLLVQFGG